MDVIVMDPSGVIIVSIVAFVGAAVCVFLAYLLGFYRGVSQIYAYP